MLGCFHIKPNHIHKNAVMIPMYLFNGIMSWLVRYTVASANTVADHLTTNSNLFKTQPIIH
jgi:hypothetical protein